MIGGEEASLAELIDSFLGETPALLDALQTARRAAMRRSCDARPTRSNRRAHDFGALELPRSSARSRRGPVTVPTTYHAELVTGAVSAFEPVRARAVGSRRERTAERSPAAALTTMSNVTILVVDDHPTIACVSRWP